MTERTFLIQRYSGANWPQVRGDVPFLATGPNFYRWHSRDSIRRHLRHIPIPILLSQISEGLGDLELGLAKECAAEMLLEEGIVQALWAAHSPVPPEDRMAESIRQLAREIPSDEAVELVVCEYLSGLADPGHFRSYVSEDQIELVPLPCPTS